MFTIVAHVYLSQACLHSHICMKNLQMFAENAAEADRNMIGFADI